MATLALTGPAFANDDAWTFEIDRSDQVATIVPGAPHAKTLSLTCIRDGLDASAYDGRADIRPHGIDEVIVYITRSSVGSNRRGVGETAPVAFAIDGGVPETVDLVRVRPENRLFAALPRSGGLLGGLEEAQSFTVTGDGRTQEIALTGFVEALDRMRSYCGDVDPDALDTVAETPAVTLPAPAPARRDPAQPNTAAAVTPAPLSPAVPDDGHTRTDRRAGLRPGAQPRGDTSWAFRVKSHGWQGTIQPGRTSALSMACLRPGIEIGAYNALSGVSIANHAPGEIVLYVTRTAVGSQRRGVGEVAPVVFWIDGEEALTLDMVRVRRENALTINVPADFALFDRIASADTLEISGDTILAPVSVQGFAQALAQLKTHCLTPLPPPDLEPENTLSTWYGTLECRGFDRTRAELVYRADEGSPTGSERFEGTMTIAHEAMLTRGVPTFALAGRADMGQVRFVVTDARGGRPPLRQIAPFVFDPATGEGTFDNAEVCSTMALAPLNQNSLPLLPTLAATGGRGTFVEATSQDGQCEAIVTWINQVGQEYPDPLHMRRPSSSAIAWHQVKLLSDPSFVPVFGQAFDQMSEERREEIRYFLRDTCLRDPFYSDRLTLWRESIGNTFYGPITESRTNNMSPLAALLALRQIRQLEHALANAPAQVAATQEDTDRAIAMLKDLRSTLNDQADLLWPSTAQMRAGEVQAAISALTATALRADVADLAEMADDATRLRAANALQDRLAGADTAELSSADRSTIRDDLIRARHEIVDRVTSGFLAQARTAGPTLDDVRAIYALRLPNALAQALTEQERTILARAIATEADTRLAGLLEPRLAALDGVTPDRAGLGESLAWIQQVRRDFGEFDVSEALRDAVARFVGVRETQLKGALGQFQSDLDIAGNADAVQSLVTAYLGWPPDLNMPVSAEYRFLAQLKRDDIARSSSKGETPPWQRVAALEAFRQDLAASFGANAGIPRTAAALETRALQAYDAIAQSELPAYRARIEGTPDVWRSYELLSDNLAAIEALILPAFQDYAAATTARIEEIVDVLEEQAITRIGDFEATLDTNEDLTSLGEEEAAIFDRNGRPNEAQTIRRATATIWTDIMRRDLPLFEADLAALPASYAAADQLLTNAQTPVTASNQPPVSQTADDWDDVNQIYAATIRTRAEQMLTELCTVALRDAGLAPPLSDRLVLVDGAPMAAGAFVCALDRLGHDVREFAAPGTLAEGQDVTFRVAQKDEGPFDFALLRAVEALPGQSTFVGFELGDALRRDTVGLTEWQAYSAVLMGRQAPAGSTSQQSVFAQLREATVWIVFNYQGDCDGGRPGQCLWTSSGTGSFISPTHILTNAHVVETKDRNGRFDQLVETGFVASRAFGVRPFRLVKNARRQTASTADAAVIEVLDYKSPAYLRFAQEFALDQYIASAGHAGAAGDLDARYITAEGQVARGQPLPPSDLPSPVLVDGRVNNIIQNGQTGLTELLYSMQTAGGTSGSAVVNECGQIVGLHYAGLSGPDEYNIGVSHPPVEAFLSAADIPFSKAKVPCALER